MSRDVRRTGIRPYSRSVLRLETVYWFVDSVSTGDHEFEEHCLRYDSTSTNVTELWNERPWPRSSPLSSRTTGKVVTRLMPWVMAYTLRATRSVNPVVMCRDRRLLFLRIHGATKDDSTARCARENNCGMMLPLNMSSSQLQSVKRRLDRSSPTPFIAWQRCLWHETSCGAIVIAGTGRNGARAVRGTPE